MNSSESLWCTETKECLLYNLVCEAEGYEVRHYETAKWVSADAESYFMEIAANRAFAKLIKYITGDNEAGVKIDMTVPVIIKVREQRSVWKMSVYSFSLLLPSAHQREPPKLSDGSIYFLDMPDMLVYVRSYGGWLMSFISSLQANFLHGYLDHVDASYNHEYRYDVGYDSPMKTFVARHNELWYIVEGEPVCPAPQGSR